MSQGLGEVVLMSGSESKSLSLKAEDGCLGSNRG